MEQNGQRTSNKWSEKKLKLKTKLRIYLCILYVLRNVNCCTLLPVPTIWNPTTFISHQPIAMDFAIFFVTLFLSFPSLSSENKHKIEYVLHHFYAFALFSPFRCRIFMKWWYTFRLHVIALFMLVFFLIHKIKRKWKIKRPSLVYQG